MTTTTFDRTSRRAAVPDPVPSPSGAELWHQASGRGVDTRFGPPRGAHLPLYECLPAFPLRHPLAGHEQGAARMADGYARSSGKVGVCNATSGPGALNLITGLATAHFDSIPVVAVTVFVTDPVSLLRATTDAFGTTAPDESKIVPEIVPRSLWATRLVHTSMQPSARQA